MARLRTLPRRFYRRDAREVAVELLNKVLVVGDRSGRIVEVEAYVGGGADPGSHAYRGMTPRNASMFGPPGHLYVYFTYGMHWCANAVCSPEGTASAVLLRGLEPLTGLEAMRHARPRSTDRDLCRGPARLCQALGVTGTLDGVDICAPSGGVRIADDGTPPPDQPANGYRVGIRAGAGDDLPWRWWVPGDPHVSRGPVRIASDHPPVTRG